VPVAVLVRMFLVGSIAVGASVWAIHRYYFVPRPSMLAPVPAATELPAPELEPSR
jgi:RsiW-degrading membrane proteinase PrsW (M82 family)